MTRCTLLVAATLLSAAAAVAQITESEANRNLKSGLSVRMKADLASLKSEQKEFLSVLKDFGNAVKGGGYSFTLLQDLFFDFRTSWTGSPAPYAPRAMTRISWGSPSSRATPMARR